MKSGLVSLISTIVGILSMFFIYNEDIASYGFSQILLTAAFLIGPIANLGIQGGIVRFFPDFQDNQDKRAAFLTFGYLVGLAGAVCLLLLGWGL
ncbi:MAG: hypothetical protein AAFN92_18915, partial [Bacteroidota bacterium]